MRLDLKTIKAVARPMVVSVDGAGARHRLGDQSPETGPHRGRHGRTGRSSGLLRSSDLIQTGVCPEPRGRALGLGESGATSEISNRLDGEGVGDEEAPASADASCLRYRAPSQGDRGGLAAGYCSFDVRAVWFSSNFCTRQLFMSATNSTFSSRQESPWIQLNCPGPRPDSPRYPSISPSRVIL
jgi:hypothetical protein